MISNLIFDVKKSSQPEHTAAIFSSADPSAITEIVWKDGEPETFFVNVWQEIGTWSTWFQEYFDDHLLLGQIQGQDWNSDVPASVMAESLITGLA